jgi:hypothetical protein
MCGCLDEHIFSLTNNVVFYDDHSIEIRNKLILLLKLTYVISLQNVKNLKETEVIDTYSN